MRSVITHIQMIFCNKQLKGIEIIFYKYQGSDYRYIRAEEE